MEEIKGGIEDLNIYKGVFRGYALYVTSERVIGAKMKRRGSELFKFLMGWRGSIKKSSTPLEWREEIVKIPTLTGEEASRVLEDLKGRIDFEVDKREIQKVELKKPGTLRPGHVKIRTTAGKEYTIGIVARATEDYEYLKELFKSFCPDKLEVKE